MVPAGPDAYLTPRIVHNQPRRSGDGYSRRQAIFSDAQVAVRFSLITPGADVLADENIEGWRTG